jgi:GT2 family glycosyltransferase
MLLGRDDDRTELLGGDHHLRLERRAALALSARDFATAFSYADRRCRIEPPPPSHCFVLRAEAAWRLGRREAALDDLAEAVEIDPANLAANRRMLAWGDEALRRAAAARLIAHEQDPAVLRSAIAALRAAGEQHWAAVSVLDSHVTGWVAWSAEGHVEAAIISEDASLTSLLNPDPFHPLANREVQATSFRLLRSRSTDPQRLTLSCSGAAFLQRRLPPNLGLLRSFAGRADKTNSGVEVDTRPTVIVPVYADREATIACFESLLKAGSASTKGAPAVARGSFRVLAVDDASPDPALRRYLKQLANDNRIDLLINSANLGFVGTVNRALAELRDGDVILLNADTLVPPGFAERLTAAAHSQADIGTATPLSNNGDIFSFPRAGFDNPMPTYEEMLALDHAAATANPMTVVDTPSGIGFCLYITRRCLDTIGGLSESFERGYLEDVDFCLRARERGFRNVCAASVYVAHHGSKSFKGDKRGLVLRNLRVLDQRFPSHRKECLAFEAADPLRAIRSKLERALGDPACSSVLIAAASGAGLGIAQTRARQLEADGERAILIVRDKGALRLTAFDASPPQATPLNLPFDLSRGDGSAAETLYRLRPSRLEITDPNVSPRLLELARQLDLPTELWITDDLSLSHVDAANRLLAPTEIAEAFVRSKLPDRRVLVRPWPTQRLCFAETAPAAAKLLAIVPGSPSARAWQTIYALATQFQRFDEPPQIVVAGPTADDQTLMAFPNIFVTGQVEATELGRLLAPYNPGWLLTDFERPLFGHPMVETARTANRPVAFRDWSFGKLRLRDRDLAISADASDTALAEGLAQWIATS